MFSRRHWRGWLLAIPLLIVAGGLVWTWIFRDIQRQDKHLSTLIILLIGHGLFLLWIIAASGWRPAVRWVFVGGTAAVCLFAGLTLRISGVTGDLLPILKWRWSRSQRAAVPASKAPSPIATGSEWLTNSFPQFMGPERNGIIPGPPLDEDWKNFPPRELWRRAVGASWSGFVVSGERAITQEQQGENEIVSCYHAGTGALLWSHFDQSRYATTIAGEGPRATPTIASNRVVTMGANGRLNCLELATGKVLWTHDTLGENHAPIPTWGVACSPLVNGRAVIVTIGGTGHSVAAYDLPTGTKLWASGHDDPHWCSPVRLMVGSTPQIVVFGENVTAYAEEDGNVLWQHPWRTPNPHVTSPALVGTNRVLISQGYGGGSELLELSVKGSRWKAERVWKSHRLKSKFANLIIHKGHVYGLDDGMLACLDLASGVLKWKGERYGHGQLLLVEETLLVTVETGEIALVNATPSEAREVARFKALNSKTWNPPALAGELLLLRNDREAVALRISRKAGTVYPQATLK